MASRPTYLEALTERYVSGVIELEEFEALVEQALGDRPFAQPSWYPLDAVLKAMYRGPIRDLL